MIQGVSMRLSENGSGGTIRVLRWLSVVALLFPALLFAAAAWKDRLTILEGAEDGGVKIAALFHEQAGNLFTGHAMILDMIVHRMQGRDWDALQPLTELLQDLEVMDRRLDGASEILLVDPEDRVRATTVPPQSDQPPPAADHDCFGVLSRGEAEVCISRPHTDPVSGHYLFSLSRRIDKDGAFNGIAQVAISADYILGLWASVTPSPSDIVTMFKTDGTVLAQSGPQPSDGSHRPSVAKSLLDQIGHDDAGIIRAPLSDGGVDRITIYTKVTGSPVYISLSLDKAAILATWYANLAIYGLVAASAAAGIMMAIGFAMRRARRERYALDRWQAEIQERQRAQEQLHQSQKMESLGKLTGGIAHDFNNLLTAVTGNLEMIEARVTEPRLLSHVAAAMRSALRGGQLTQQLLAYARRQNLSPRPVDVNAVIVGMDELLHRSLGGLVRVETDLAADLWPATCDPTQLELVVLNLAINSRDAMPAGGRLRIVTSNVHGGTGQLPTVLDPGDYVRIAVIDTGIGMSPEIMEQAFEPFFTTKDVGKGSGLGLAQVYGVTTQFGGTVRLASEPSVGTTVEVFLLRAAPLPAAPAVREPRVSQAADGDGIVLVVDDEPDVRAIAVAFLREAGYAVEEAGSGAEARDIVAAGQISLALVDYAMPLMSGAEFVRLARQLQPDLPVIYVTGAADALSLREQGRDPIVRKPYSRTGLLKIVREMLARAPALT
jgi:signal transduction histidine kinase/CheY-like chemotaxis protein